MGRAGDKHVRRTLLLIAGAATLGLTLGVGGRAAAESAPPDAMSSDGGHYHGPLARGLREGEGILEWSNGGFYQGHFRQGLFDGHGTLHRPDGTVIEGEFLAGDVSGFGTLTNRFMTYRGHFAHGNFEGSGEAVLANGGRYVGEFVLGHFQGQGQWTTPAGEFYSGEFVDDEPSGTGVFLRDDGSRQEGQFAHGELDGAGRLVMPDGRIYEGVFTQGTLSSTGRYFGPEGEHYQGGFKNFVFEGQGTLVRDNGDRYEGAFHEGMYNGQGTLTYARPQPDGVLQRTGVWRYGSLVDHAADTARQLRLEAAIYAQRPLLDAALAALKPRNPGRINLYLLAVGGDGDEEVFHREVDFVQAQFDRDFGTAGHSLVLLNSRETLETRPMATRTSVREGLLAIAARMDRDHDILFVYLTSHGSHDHQLVLAEGGLPLAWLDAQDLADMLRETRVRWKVVVVSACYSGGFLAPLEDEHTLVITAARADRTSFGCSDDADMTWFGKAYFREALPVSGSFSEAFQRARALISAWEETRLSPGQDPEPVRSYPQIQAPSAIEAYLAGWWAQLPGH